MADPKAESAPVSGPTDPPAATDQAQKSAAPAADRAEQAADAGDGINAHITDAIPGREPKPELDPGDPGINASVVS